MRTIDSARDLRNFHLGGMVFSCVQAQEVPVERVLRWHRATRALGTIPLFLTHDLGMLLAYPPAAYRIEPHPAAPPGIDFGAYLECLRGIARQPLVARIRAWGVGDRTVGVATARVFAQAAAHLAGAVDTAGLESGDATLERALPAAIFSVPEIARAHAAGPSVRVEEVLSPAVLAALAAGIDRLTLNEIQFLELFGGTEGEVDLQSMVDLVEFAGLTGPLEAVLEDLMCLVPSILGTGRGKNEQHYPVAGVSGIALRGSLDSIVPSEYALPAPVFRHRFCNGGLLYFGRERPREKERNLFYLVVNTGFSMAGDPEILTRVLGIALAKKMALQGCDFGYSTFDEDLAPVLPLASAADYRYFLAYRSERATKERQVLEALSLTLRRLRADYDRITVLLVTHLHFCDCDDRYAKWFERMKEDARLTGILIASDLEIEKSAASHARSYKDLSYYLDRKNVLSYGCLRDARRRREEERRIVVDV